MKKKKHFNPTFIYVLLFAFNFFDFILSDYFALSSTASMISRLVVEGVLVLVSVALLVVGVYYVFDRDLFFRTWEPRMMYGGYSLHYCAVSALGHALLLADAVTITVMGESYITRGIFDAMAIGISFAIMVASIGVAEPQSKEIGSAALLPTHHHVHAHTTPSASPISPSITPTLTSMNSSTAGGNRQYY